MANTFTVKILALDFRLYQIKLPHLNNEIYDIIVLLV